MTSCFVLRKYQFCVKKWRKEISILENFKEFNIVKIYDSFAYFLTGFGNQANTTFGNQSAFGLQTTFGTPATNTSFGVAVAFHPPKTAGGK